MIFPEIIDVMKAKGYTVYDNPVGFDLNIVGVRSATQESNKFDDTLIVFYKQHGNWIYNFLT